ncbi:FeoA family protein [Halothermothrix orenii]|uniref:Ferrous iron transport protein FeoA n=1 Tax=Halothermothrix orenii (strain H 168 / OCM 544 / DSM 9562) TaxID=373903 RepID=B8D1F6_HALOH|nr:FeoA family protein [Halothermothrix orenii]ACL69033.1 Ferrous iron transport protein FeoA [Halothermothrix orenii H 168]
MILTQLPIGTKGKVINLTARGNKRRRLLDLGLIPGTTVEPRRRSPSGDPTAYLIRGTVLALRKEETDLVKVSQ